MTKRLLALCLSLVLLLSLVPMAMPVSADEDKYPNTHTNTGNQRYDIIQVALTQVGYQEGKSNYNKYGEYFGNANTAWCGYFVSWCAAKAGVPTSVLKRQGRASASAFGLSKTFKASERTPQSGDLYFKSGHVGLVYKVEGKYFWSVEGNSSDQVEIEKLELYSSKYWFASPNYGGSNNTSHTHSYETGYDSKHPHKEYKKCSSCGYTTYTDNTRTVDDCTDCIQENCKHEYGSWESTGSSKHKQVCTKCGKENTGSHDWEDYEILSDPTCKEEGSKIQRCEVCNAERKRSIEKTNDHSYGDWEYEDDEQHSRTCSFCGKKVKKDHDLEDGDQWQTTDTEHWHECSVCEEKFQLETHDFGENCVDPCEVCEYIRPEGHKFGEQWLTDETNHWLACINCDAISNQEEHVYSSACDEDCDVCGYIREVEHSYSDTLNSDGTSHWIECDVCGKITGHESHSPGAQATEENAQTCTACGRELMARIVHVHDFGPMQSDAHTHWGTCRCGLELGPEPHSWDMTSGNCSLCGVTGVAQSETQNWDFVWLILCGAVVCTVVVTTSVMIHSRKKRKALEGDPYWA